MKGMATTTLSESFEITILPLTKLERSAASHVLVEAYTDEWRFREMFGPLEKKSRLKLSKLMIDQQIQMMSKWKENGGYVAVSRGKVIGAAIWIPPSKLLTKIPFFQLIKFGLQASKVLFFPIDYFRPSFSFSYFSKIKGVKLSIAKKAIKIYSSAFDKFKEEVALQKGWTLMFMGVSEQNKGVGTLLIKQICRFCDEMNYPIFSYTLEERTLNLFYRNGFTIVRKEEYPDNNLKLWFVKRDPIPKTQNTK